MTNIRLGNDPAKGSGYSFGPEDAIIDYEHLATEVLEEGKYSYLLEVDVIWPDASKKKFRFEAQLPNGPVDYEINALNDQFLREVSKNGLPLYTYCKNYVVHRGVYKPHSYTNPMLYINGRVVSTFLS